MSEGCAWEDRERHESDNPWTGGYLGSQFKSDVMENFLEDALHIAKRTVHDEVTTKMTSQITRAGTFKI